MQFALDGVKKVEHKSHKILSHFLGGWRNRNTKCFWAATAVVTIDVATVIVKGPRQSVKIQRTLM